ncbi:MAG: hypothetical protein KME49_08430 [Brasilonema octagenarum HA4186-MV1]|jgi:hypothetical protein|uniref:Uncharacterized protein n=2 Tax=Brasilonema TaxID=383614 RepID=A0A856MDR5_9CYAN|nr:MULTISPECIES: hypothetical protein [Brasilonema]MBW4625516.1 hypothetical protein [Brasilonema octagenarum HA4186-MV1]NMF61842.1 hypothetical protein [Brasilonema octagenarum UFV-OR1]QDL08249.1 hypothetical protein DP114_10330 [Brasilonema sennae CENA114]QDL14605.1 hypothetical protein DP113_10275 [Brasilonema octagenarum UFV-E1]
MPFQKKHKLGFTSEQPFDKDPVCFKVLPGVKDKLKSVPDWQGRIREFVDKLIDEVNVEGD